MSTPRTDANRRTVFWDTKDDGALVHKPDPKGLYVSAALSDELETELQACYAVMEEMKEALEAGKPNSRIFTSVELRNKALASYAKLKSQKP